jgi:sulfur carrier protein
MKITLNGKTYEIAEGVTTVSQLVAGLDIGKQPVLVERNGEAVLLREFENEPVADGDRIEVIRMVAGG